MSPVRFAALLRTLGYDTIEKPVCQPFFHYFSLFFIFTITCVNIGTTPQNIAAPTAQLQIGSRYARKLPPNASRQNTPPVLPVPFFRLTAPSMRSAAHTSIVKSANSPKSCATDSSSSNRCMTDSTDRLFVSVRNGSGSCRASSGDRQAAVRNAGAAGRSADAAAVPGEMRGVSSSAVTNAMQTGPRHRQNASAASAGTPCGRLQSACTCRRDAAAMTAYSPARHNASTAQTRPAASRPFCPASAASKSGIAGRNGPRSSSNAI